MAWFFGFFLVSGFCSILYELIWLRLAMAQFGVTTALVSIVLSMFMAGLGAGSWLAGSRVRNYKARRSNFPPLGLYALAELLIGISALTVPVEFRWGAQLLAWIAGHGTISSLAHYLASGAILAVALIPWCACMGATIPLAMFAIGDDPRRDARHSFSFLYVANLVGSTAGCSVPLLLIELYGFHTTLGVGAALNAAIAGTAWAVTLARKSDRKSVPGAAVAAVPIQPAAVSIQAEAVPVHNAMADGTADRSSVIPALLFVTGFATMGMEVIWIRLFTPYVGPVVYAFALILGTYLAATFGGSQMYRLWSRVHDREARMVWVLLALLGLLPLLTSDSRLALAPPLRVILGIAPFAAVIGFLTPMLVDRWSKGDPGRAGRAYAVNVVGCVLGPLVSGFVLLPLAGEHWSMLLFALPWMAMAIPGSGAVAFPRAQRATAYAFILGALALFGVTNDFETQFTKLQVLRDDTATVIATGEGMEKRLLVNGIGMTTLTPITKMMAHLPLAWLDRKPREVLIICFGMGTSSLAALSWGIRTTTVELVPSVPRLVGYFHPGRAAMLDSPQAHVVIDDGRRYLDRTSATYDVILIDPPPPVWAAASSLLYSRDFYRIAKLRLRPGGIFQQWLPDGDPEVLSSVARALRDSFPYVRVYRSLEGWGWHFSASMTPLPDRTPAELALYNGPGAICPGAFAADVA
jgi:predicted membrane-bound spermidine synthase